MKSLVISLILWVIGLGSSVAQDVEFKVSAPSVVEVGEQFRLEYVLTQQGENLQLPTLKGFELLAGPSMSTSFSMSSVNGKTTTTSEYTYTFVLSASEEGEFTIAPATITVDGKEISGLTRSSLRKAYTMVLQDTWLFTGTIYENISYGKEDATLEDVVQACKAANIHEAIMQMPQGYETVLTGDGSGLSKGQKQMLTIARAMLLDSKMLILDEATSNVDTQTEKKIQLAMRELMKGKTCFVIAHRLSTIQNADHILVVQNGDIVEQGMHDTLLKQGGLYSKLYYSQFQ